MSFSLQDYGAISILMDLNHAWFLHIHKECRTCRPLRWMHREIDQIECQGGKKLLLQLHEVTTAWREILPQLNYEYKDAWEDYDKHTCLPGEPRCTVEVAASRFRPVPRHYRLIACSLGYKLANERFERLGFDNG